LRNLGPTLAAFLNDARNADAPMFMADAFTLTLANGEVAYWSSLDVPFVYNGHTFLANGPMVQGLKMKCSVGLETDRQQVVLMARPTDLFNGAQVLQLIASGGLKGASIERDWVFFTSNPARGGTVVGGAIAFKGFVSKIDEVGRSTAKFTVASPLVLLDYDMPHNLYSLTCNHTLYDSGCGLSASSFETSAVVGAASTSSLINFAGANAGHAQGKLVFTSGANDGISATVKSVVPSVSVTLMYPMPETPSPGDAFNVYFGCDHTSPTCLTKFNNQINFRGFPFVPPPQLSF
jgi:uncharacterized phage protein (TIGR02218 family)